MTITIALRVLQERPNATIAAMLFLLVVLAMASFAQLRVAIGMAVTAMLVFNFFLLPPFYTFRVAGAQNWVALFVFVVVAVIASRLSSAVHERASEAEARRQEVSRLFDLTRDILLTTDSDRAIGDVARHVARRFELEAVAICLPTATGWDVQQGGAHAVEPSIDQLGEALARMHGPLEYNLRERAYGGHVEVGDQRARAILVPLRLGSQSIGFLATQATALDLGALDALSGVIAIAIERAHFLAERKHAETLSQRADLASALLASFSHDLRTPVTSIRVAVTNIQDAALSGEERQVQAALALQQLDRLTRLFEDILDMARIDAAAVRPQLQWVSPVDIVDAAVTHVAPVIASHTLEIEADGVSEIQVDPRLTAIALGHLLENAAIYSAAGAAIVIRAWTDSDGGHFAVRDYGPGLDAADLSHLFEPFYRGRTHRQSSGTGLGLSITRGLLAAEGGRVWGENVSGGGAQFTIVVPSDVRLLDGSVA
jgi:two-component system sensor histidine kinase KdpD